MFFEIESKKEKYMMREGMGKLPADDIEFCLYSTSLKINSMKK